MFERIPTELDSLPSGPGAAEDQADDAFMVADDTNAWSGVRLFHHLVSRLGPSSPHLPLNSHTMHTLVASRPALLMWHVGVRDPESVAEHSLRTAQIAALLAAEEGANPERAAFLALWHDTQKTRTGDIPHTAAKYMSKPDPREITADQTAALPGASRELIRTAVDEYETRQTPEARCAKDADKLEMLLQAVEYRETGVERVAGWIDSMRKGLATETARRVAEAAVTLYPLVWRDRKGQRRHRPRQPSCFCRT